MAFKKIAVLFLLAGLGVSLEAAAVSFLVVETGLPPEAGVNTYSSLWENSLLDVFFDAGHIVSNVPTLRLKNKPGGELPDEARDDIAEAAEGGMDFFIVAILEYRSDSETETADIKPRQVSLRIFTTSPYRMLFEQLCTEKTNSSMDDEFVWVKQEVRKLLPRLSDT
ncbi:MAG: hypothetical protein LBI86_07020 [Treponema sp.]|jgi:hypothetical protein|nr:hypothetical protein [Treponema sp.]